MAGLAWSLGAAAAESVGNPDVGKKKFYTCEGCHGVVGYTNSYPTYHVPKLGGQHPAYLKTALKEYQSGERKHPSMQGNSASLSEKDMDDIIAYISKYRGLNEAMVISGDAAAGKKKAAACASCHGDDGNSTDPNFPRLAAQYESYLVQALIDYKTGARKNAIMAGFAAGLSEQDRLDLAAFYASQKKGLTLAVD
jgi:cytochrome c553